MIKKRVLKLETLIVDSAVFDVIDFKSNSDTLILGGKSFKLKK